MNLPFRFTYLVSLIFLVSQLSAQHTLDNSTITSTSPKDQSFLHRPQTSILIKSTQKLDLDKIHELYSAEIVGSQSGIHAFNISLSDNKKALVFNPKVEFDLGEQVVFNLKRKSDEYLIMNITFAITSNNTSSYVESSVP